MQDGFLRAAAASIPVAVADPRRNAAAVCARIDQAHRARAALLVLPELCVTGYTCGDLFLSALLLDAAEEALLNICAHTQNCDPVVVLGVPLRAGGKLYNCAAVLHRGRILGVVPKTWLPNYDVFAEKRCFASAAAYHGPGSVPVSGADVPFGTGLVFACAQMPAFRLGVELCEDVWAPIPPSVRLCLAGATVIANCSASPEAAGKPARRRTLLRAASARGLCGYVYANAGPDESSARAVFSAHHLIAENGDILAEHAPFAPEPGLLVTELDLLTLSAERRRNTTFVPEGAGARAVSFSMPLRPTALSRAVSPHPFVPDDAAKRRKRAELLLSIQAHGLRKRLLHTGSRAALLPVTDDLDSVLALLVCARTMDLLGRARHDVLAVTQPGGDRVRVLRLCKALGVSVRPNADRAGLARTHAALPLAAPDFTALLLGEAVCAPEAYGVNAAVPRTLVRWLIAAEAERAEEPLRGAARRALRAGRRLRGRLVRADGLLLLPPRALRRAPAAHPAAGPRRLRRRGRGCRHPARHGGAHALPVPAAGRAARPRRARQQRAGAALAAGRGGIALGRGDRRAAPRADLRSIFKNACMTAYSAAALNAGAAAFFAYLSRFCAYHRKKSVSHVNFIQKEG